MKAELKNIDKYEINRGSVVKKRLTNVPVPVSRGNRRDDGTPSPNAEGNYIRRMKKRAKTIKEKCRNCFSVGNAVLVGLTFDKQKCADIDLKDIKQTHKEFNKFIKRVNRRYEGFCYVATFDKQGMGNWHYHMMCNFPVAGNYIEARIILENLWQNGRVYFSEVLSERHFNNCVRYMNRNMFNHDSDKRGIKGYLASRNAKGKIVVSSGRVTDKQKFKKIDNDVKQYTLEEIYSTKKRVGFIQEINGTKDVIVDFDNQYTFVPAGYQPLDMEITAFSSPVRYDNLFPRLETAKPKPISPKKGTKKKAKKPANKHTKDNNQTPQNKGTRSKKSRVS